MKTTYSIIVSYYPNTNELSYLIENLIEQTDGVIIVDNTPPCTGFDIDNVLYKNIRGRNITIIRLGKNNGIASALNIGIFLAIAKGADLLFLSDQDSVPDKNMIKNLKLAFQTLSKDGKKIGAVGPSFLNSITGRLHPFQVKIPRNFFYSYRNSSLAYPYVDTLTLITSGILIPVDVIQHVGYMREDFFIDNVDIEWSFRAKSLGYRLFGVYAAKMQHRMGDDFLRVWCIEWRTIILYSPLRAYYQIRNYVCLCRLSYIDRHWIIKRFFAVIVIFFINIIFGKNRLHFLKMWLLGLFHGITNKMGSYNS